MKFTELTLTCYLKTNVHFTKANELISRFINKSMLLNQKLLEIHKQTGYKFYCFSSFYPLEKDKIYKAGRIYVFNIRSLDKKIITDLKCIMSKNESNSLKVIAAELKTVKRSHIVELYTLTPAVITIEGNKHWIPGNKIDIVLDRFQGNLEKKYNQFCKQQINPKQNFIQRLEVLNKKTFSFPYKNTHFLASRYRLDINDDEASQKLAFIAAATGIGEKSSSLGMGFCNYQFLK